ncbi:mannose-6-phosphate receptor binding domain-containing protein [Amylocarpus encephaloides]|uniref:Mannose-6-phosphate receptor binding domain-containing protein n=1 Tax=Amylocarpus encephaloides TaxID=45428 RepID=A0A9P7YJ67_9HELO|nr:mannose-6-phosphate receptor binding domain-containing protein [Amylocarpus encephaloides]
MYFPRLPASLLLALALHYRGSTAADEKLVEPCTAVSSSGSFYDLRQLSILPLKDGQKANKNDKTTDYHAKGYDIPYNFTLNICAPVVEKQDDFAGIKEKLAHNVSAFYEQGDERYSIGQQSSNLTIRGKRLVLQYINGSPCGGSGKRAAMSDVKRSKAEGSGRKSTTISFHCDKDPLAKAPIVSFVNVDPDECSYVFEVLSKDACIGAPPAKQGVGPAAVFSIIGIIAILVYFLGGVFYQRNVAHARGWRQLPNYSMWAGIGDFIKDLFIIAASSCSRCLPTRRGYSALSISANDRTATQGRGRGGNGWSTDDENRLIDQLDEEWDN